MRYGVLGTGMVGQAIASKLVSLGHEVKMGSRTADNPKALAWVDEAGAGASAGTFEDAAGYGAVIFNATMGSVTMAVLNAAGSDNLAGKILIDLTNPLDFSQGMPPSLFISGGQDSLGEQVQAAFPETRVVKTLNTVNADAMVDPSLVGDDHTVFVCGNDEEAKATVKALLSEGFGWRDVLDLGDITQSRGTEAYLLLWVRLWGALGTANFNIKVVRGEPS